jgi:hypothetical protein
MKTTQIIKEIQRLPISKRIYVIEKTIRSIRKQEDNDQLKTAADKLYDIYESDWKKRTNWFFVKFGDA